MIHADNDKVLAKSLFGRHDQENIGDRNVCVLYVNIVVCTYMYYTQGGPQGQLIMKGADGFIKA